MTEQQITQAELMESITGFDELAVDKHFGIDVYIGDPSHPVTLLRALVFIDRRHHGDTDAQAKEHALGLTISAVHDYFSDDPEDFDPEEPDSDAGKGASEPDAAQPTSPTSTTAPA